MSDQTPKGINISLDDAPISEALKDRIRALCQNAGVDPMEWAPLAVMLMAAEAVERATGRSAPGPASDWLDYYISYVAHREDVATDQVYYWLLEFSVIRGEWMAMPRQQKRRGTEPWSAEVAQHLQLTAEEAEELLDAAFDDQEGSQHPSVGFVDLLARIARWEADGHELMGLAYDYGDWFVGSSEERQQQRAAPMYLLYQRIAEGLAMIPGPLAAAHAGQTMAPLGPIMDALIGPGSLNEILEDFSDDGPSPKEKHDA